jgi:para-aminobenzoate synthetase component 1
LIKDLTFQKNAIFPVNDFREIKEKVLNWAQQFNTFCFLDNHQYQIAPHTLECILGAGTRRKISANAGDKTLAQLQQFIDEKQTWLFGHLGYDLRNEQDPAIVYPTDHIQFPDLFFFEPEVIIRLNEKEMIIIADDPEVIYKSVIAVQPAKMESLQPPVVLKNRMQRDEYLSVIRQLQKHILRGDCYEINFCQEFYSDRAEIDPVAVYKRLMAVSPNPFSALYRLNDKWLICASPERFLKKQANRILSQPIKGTSKRVSADSLKDELSKEELLHSAKDRSENVMVVDLVRNDLSRICLEGTVHVDELYGIYSFPQVHQMISTVSGVLKNDISFAGMIEATFPMGSMTGAPKKRVMELISRYEKIRRGIFSGALGYISPEGDFDLNVVIRSIMYNASLSYLSIQAGSGITFYSDAEKEWEECLLKVSAMKDVLNH